jgi:hypothetical protein
VCGFADTFRQGFDGFQIRFLGCHQAENDELIVRHIAQRLKRAGAVIVILQQQALGFDAAEQLAADSVVTSSGKPPARLVAASHVKSKGDIGKSSHHGVVELDTE